MTPRSQSLFSLASAAALMLLAVCAHATDYYVATNGDDTKDGLTAATAFKTIQKAITTAPANSTINVADGTYTGAGNINLDFGGKNLTLRSISGDPTSCIIDCENAGRGFYFHSKETSDAKVMGFTIQNGFSDPNVSIGAGMYIIDSNPTIDHCILTHNSSAGMFGGEGGGLRIEDASPTITNCALTDNTAGFFAEENGAGVYINGAASNPQFQGCTFSGNGAGGSGGGLYIKSGNVTLTDCVFSGNNCINGSGMFMTDSSATITRCAFTGNGGGYGVGMYVQNASPTLTNCTFSGNSGGPFFDLGAGLYITGASSKPQLTNCTLVGNANGGEGGGMYVQNASPTLTNCTFSSNSDFIGAGAIRIVTGGSVTVTNSILWGDSGEISADATSSATVSYSDVQGGAEGTANLDTDPLFVDAPNEDLHLQPLSPCLDAGDDMVVTVPPFPANADGDPLDLDDTLRIQRTHVDLGAYEHENLAPTAEAQSLSLDQDKSLDITLTGSDPENDDLTYTPSNPVHGTLSGTAPNLTYTPDAGYVGPDSFTFTVRDAYGAASSSATVSITVKDALAPVITLNGSDPMTVNQGSVFTDPGATAVDNVDGSVPVSVSGSVNTAIPGTYTLTYSAEDAAGNRAIRTRTVNVASALVIEQVTLKRSGNNAQVKFVIRNTRTTTASNVRLTAATLGGVSPSQTLPMSLGSLAGGSSVSVTLTFKVSAGTKTLSLSGSSSFGVFSLSQSVQVP